MADISDTNSALNTKLVGADATGVEQTPVASTTEGRLQVEANFATDYTTSSIGALRIVESQNVFESLFSFDKQSLVWDEQLVSGGTSTFNSNTNSVDMTLPTTNGASVVRQTFRRIHYNPSRTVQVFSAGTLGAPKANVRKRIGQFDVSDGLFFEHDGLTVNVVRRSSTSGSVVDTKIAQSSWNIDKFDGTGPSGVTIDFTKHQLFYMQYAFQGFGDLVFGFYHNGRVRFCHRIAIANVIAVPSMKTGHLPCRIEITNTAASASSTTISYNSFTVKNEGKDSDQEGQVRSYSGAALKTVAVTTTPVISIRLASGFEKAIVDLVKTSIFVQSADEVIWTIYLSPTLTGSTFATTSSFVNIDTAATTMTGGTELLSGVLSQNNNSGEIVQDLLSAVNSYFGVSLAGTPTIITLAARSRAGTADVLSTVVWKEYP